jgi:hypothetical protein
VPLEEIVLVDAPILIVAILGEIGDITLHLVEIMISNRCRLTKIFRKSIFAHLTSLKGSHV